MRFCCCVFSFCFSRFAPSISCLPCIPTRLSWTVSPQCCNGSSRFLQCSHHLDEKFIARALESIRFCGLNSSNVIQKCFGKTLTHHAVTLFLAAEKKRAKKMTSVVCLAPGSVRTQFCPKASQVLSNIYQAMALPIQPTIDCSDYNHAMDGGEGQERHHTSPLKYY